MYKNSRLTLNFKSTSAFDQSYFLPEFENMYSKIFIRLNDYN